MNTEQQQSHLTSDCGGDASKTALAVQHTPAPWWVAGKATVRHGAGVNAGWIADVHWRNRKANAALIAAAPDLLAALQAFMALDKSFATTCDDHLNEIAKTNPMGVAVKLARAALAKAGVTP